MKTRFPRLGKVPHGERGNAMLEFAIGATTLVSIFAGTFQFGYTFYQYNLLKNAVENGATYAALKTYNSATSTPSNDFKTAVQNIVVYGDPGGGSTPIVPGLATNDVNLNVTFTNGVPTAMTVSISSHTIQAVFGNTTFTNKPSVTYSYQGIFQPY